METTAISFKFILLSQSSREHLEKIFRPDIQYQVLYETGDLVLSKIKCKLIYTDVGGHIIAAWK